MMDNKEPIVGSSLVAQWVKALALSLLWLVSVLWCILGLWEFLHAAGAAKKMEVGVLIVKEVLLCSGCGLWNSKKQS